jgi:hypothetical protein
MGVEPADGTGSIAVSLRFREKPSCDRIEEVFLFISLASSPSFFFLFSSLFFDFLGVTEDISDELREWRPSEAMEEELEEDSRDRDSRVVTSSTNLEKIRG